MTDEAFNAFHRSIKRGDLAVIRNALTAGVSANLENKFGWTLLMLAASEGDTAIGELLVSNGADTNRATNTGQTAMVLAIIGGHARFLKMLLAHGADPDLAGAVEKRLTACRLAPDTEQAILATIREHRENKSN
jgi:ankyrin repeat protein